MDSMIKDRARRLLREKGLPLTMLDTTEKLMAHQGAVEAVRRLREMQDRSYPQTPEDRDRAQEDYGVACLALSNAISHLRAPSGQPPRAVRYQGQLYVQLCGLPAPAAGQCVLPLPEEDIISLD